MAVANGKIECSVCCDEFTSKYNVNCFNQDCNFNCCKKCYKTYLLDHPITTKCMDCDKDFNYSFMVNTFGKTFVMGKLRKAQKRLLLEQQLAQMPVTQNCNEFKIAQLNNKIAKLRKELKVINKEKEDELINNNDTSFKEKIKLWREKQYKVWELDKERKQLIHEIRLGGHQNNKSNKKTSTIIIKCTSDNCNGFVNSSYKCNVCETSYCKECLEQVEKQGVNNDEDINQHKCKEEDIESTKLILKQSKPCPSCGTRISKINGCDQMWCTQCHVTFSWKNGTIEKGNVHNPHYFEWLRNGGGEQPIRNPLDIHCGGLVDFVVLLRKTNVNHEIYIYVNSVISYYYQKISHVTNVSLRRYRETIINLENEGYMLNKRIDFLLNKITEKQLEKTCTFREFKIKRSREILQIYELVSMAGIETINDLYNYDITEPHKVKEKVLETTTKIENLFNYINKEIKRIKYEFNCNIIDCFKSYEEHRKEYLANIPSYCYPLSDDSEEEEFDFA